MIVATDYGPVLVERLLDANGNQCLDILDPPSSFCGQVVDGPYQGQTYLGPIEPGRTIIPN